MDFLISSSSSAIASFSIYPIEVIKTNYQYNILNKRNNNINFIVRNIYRSSHLSGFYKGISSNLFSFPLFWGVYFQSSSHIKPLLSQYIDPHSFSFKFSNYLFSSSIASFIANPLFVLKTRYQILNNNFNSSYSSLIHSIYRDEGLTGFLKGFNATLLNSSKLAIQFPLYDYFFLHSNNSVLSSFFSKILTSSIFYPLDLVRTFQRNSTHSLSIFNSLKHIYSSNGLFGLYRGILMYNLVSCPNFVIMMYFINLFKSFSSSSHKQ